MTNSTLKPKVGLCGSGAIGTFYLGPLGRAAEKGLIDLYVFTTPRHIQPLTTSILVEDLKGNSIQVDSAKAGITLIDNTQPWPSEIPEFDWIVDATNVGTWDSDQINRLGDQLAEDGLYMPLVNGLPFTLNLKASEPFFPADPTGHLFDVFRDRSVVAVVNTAAGLQDPGRVLLKGSPKLEIGLISGKQDPRLEKFAGIVNQFGEPLGATCVVRHRSAKTNDIMSYVIMKWVSNFLSNALATIHGGVRLCDLSKTLEKDLFNYPDLMNLVGKEISEEMRRRGHLVMEVDWPRKAENVGKLKHVPSTAVAALDKNVKPEAVIFDSAREIALGNGNMPWTIYVLGQFHSKLISLGLAD